MKQINSNLEQEKLRKFFIKSGVKMIGPETIFFSKDTKIGKNDTINPYVVIGPKVKIGNNVIVNSFSHLEDCKIKNKVEVGPYARLRPGTILEEGSKIGNFVEVKKSTVGKKSKINHLSYIGDSEIGRNVNVGAGTITCNYDGVKKSKTKIKHNEYMWSDERKHIRIVGRCCILRFGADGKTHRTCGFCSTPHKNRSNNLCNDCRGKVCPKCCKVKLTLGHHVMCYKCFKKNNGNCEEEQKSRCVVCGVLTKGYRRCYTCHRKHQKKNADISNTMGLCFEGL